MRAPPFSLKKQCVYLCSPKKETQRFAEVTAEREFGDGKQPSRWLSILAPVITNQVEVGVSRSVPDFPPACCFLFRSRCFKWKGRISSKQGWDCFSVENVMLAFLWKGFYRQRESRFWCRGIASWVSSPGAEGLGRSHPSHVGRAI